MTRCERPCDNSSCTLQEDSQKRNIGLFFFNRGDAESLIDKVSSDCIDQRSSDMRLRTGSEMIFCSVACPADLIEVGDLCR